MRCATVALSLKPKRGQQLSLPDIEAGRKRGSYFLTITLPLA